MNRLTSFCLCLLTLALAPSAQAQSPTPTSVFPHAGSQVNTIPSCLIMTAAAQAPGLTNAFFPSTLTIFSPSTTFAYECLGTPGTTTPGTFSYFGAVEGGAPFLPFMLALAVQPSNLICGGFAGAPCRTGSSLFSSVATPHGLYHLGSNPIFIFDGIAGLAPPAFLNAGRQFPLNGTFGINPQGFGGPEPRFALQALVVDPTWPSGYRLSACLTVDQWVNY